MDTGHFYFLKDEYFIRFPDSKLMKNKEFINGQAHERPCFYAFLDTTTNIYWMIPISSQVEKYKKIYEDKVDKYGRCDTLAFGEVLGHEKVFLIQNICPTLSQYINNEYIDKNSNLPVKVSGDLEAELIQKAKKVLALQRKGFNVVFPDVLKIEQALINELKGK